MGVTGIAALNKQGQGNEQTKHPQKTEDMFLFESKFPEVSYDEPEPTDSKEYEKRQAKGRKYAQDRSGLVINPYDDVVTTSSHWSDGLSAIPLYKSVAVIVGSVSDAQAHLTPNKKKVYSEFKISVEEILNNDPDSPIQSGSSVDVDRIGGRVKFPNGKVGLYYTSGQSMPVIGGRYLLFLTRTDANSSFTILTGYELRTGHVYLLDHLSNDSNSRYEGADEVALLNDVRAAIAKQ